MDQRKKLVEKHNEITYVTTSSEQADNNTTSLTTKKENGTT